MSTNNNTGHRNTGDDNIGRWNTGSRNTGDNNTGYKNTGHRNTGCWNTGCGDTGYRNTGHRNTGDNNTGSYNTGNNNTGFFNKQDYCTGAFNTKPQKMILFNKTLDITVEEFYSKYDISAYIPLTEWIEIRNMTEEEKRLNPTYKITGGYLKERAFHEACKIWWEKAVDDEKNRFLNLPGFDSDIFKEITGIDTTEG